MGLIIYLREHSLFITDSYEPCDLLDVWSISGHDSYRYRRLKIVSFISSSALSSFSLSNTWLSPFAGSSDEQASGCAAWRSWEKRTTV
jgi:hypothetical protein